MTRRIVKLAERAALKSPSDFRIGAVLYKGNRVLGIGFNDMSKTHPKSRTMEFKRHAELAALLRADPREVKGSSIYVHRLRWDGFVGLAKPCKYCLSMLLDAGVRHIAWSEQFGLLAQR